MEDSAWDFDGVLCFGQVDWWYHNRTHFDLQIMREFSKKFPVLYVNSLGMKMPKPSEGRMFFTRISRKAKSFMRGIRKVRDNFHVFSPLSIPLLSRSALGKSLLVMQLKLALKYCGIRRPLIWVGCPTAYEVLGAIPGVKQIYQRTDRYENYAGVDPEYIARIDRELKANSDLTVFCSTKLFELERQGCKDFSYIEHGVDYSYFAGADAGKLPAELETIPSPRAVYVGGMDHGVFDPDFFHALAKELPEWNFVLVGSSAFGDDWCGELQNVYKLGKRDYSEVAAYMAAADVLIMTWCRNDWIEVCNPIKLKEYLAVGKGVVSTPFYELKRYRENILAASTPAEFAAAMERLRTEPPALQVQRARVQDITWEVQAGKILDRIAKEQ